MRYDFETMIDRRGMDSIAADMNENDFWTLPKGTVRAGFDKIPMWIADMNFPTAPAVSKALAERIAHPIYGYFVPRNEYYDAIIRWHQDSHGVTGLEKTHIGYENGVLGGITSALRVLCSEGESILVHSPTYTGFTTQLERNGFRLELSPLKKDGQGIWRMDFEDMERRIRENHIHTALFCSPHNPTGRVWERWELEQAMEIFQRNQVYVVCDEIWSDLVFSGGKHIPLQSISSEARERTIALYSPSKAFNLAGLLGSYHIIYNPWLRDRVKRYSSFSHYNDINVLSMHASIAAYSPEGRDWMEALKVVLERNAQYACDFFETRFPGVEVYRPQATFILLIDCETWCREHGTEFEVLLERGVSVGVIWRDGRAFHVPYGIRLNLALPFDKLQEALNRLERFVFTE
ncbi:MAG TPA: aminotransferase class I/II-fold pyridoxal phosphate-dependent enzyme [Candidatus Avidehalobacter gallistercoris]|uniref:cysteine-S-conjugate beta-lyase n=1 Tax=Candidatus Avidehalobacter gallistercoris TaxID=2840694 RepID=A0A9D1HKG2_9FIRM|nr:aminotransferase class I/II-fold pyridoxal phosphate-dependent enzyme [Candidatus Avidehalobacter gallistercoris]